MISPSRMRPPPPVLRTDPLGGLGEREKGGRTYEAPRPQSARPGSCRVTGCSRPGGLTAGRGVRRGRGAGAAPMPPPARRHGGGLRDLRAWKPAFYAGCTRIRDEAKGAHGGTPFPRPLFPLSLPSLSPTLPSPTPPCPLRLLGALRSTFRSLRRRYSRRWGWSWAPGDGCGRAGHRPRPRPLGR